MIGQIVVLPVRYCIKSSADESQLIRTALLYITIYYIKLEKTKDSLLHFCLLFGLPSTVEGAPPRHVVVMGTSGLETAI